jgi:hypothetical protein
METEAKGRASSGVDKEPTVVPARVTVGLIVKVRKELGQLIDKTGFNLTDVVNRAISIYRLVLSNQDEGYELVFRHKETGRERIVEFL